jgi:hypothetical protein
MPDDRNRRNVRGITSREFDRRGTSTLRNWLDHYWVPVRDGKREPNPGDSRAQAPGEIEKLTREIKAREDAGYAGPNRHRSWQS